MHVQGPRTIKQARKIAELAHDAIKAEQDAGEDNRYLPSVQIALLPKDTSSSSEVLSFLKSVEAALSKFPTDRVIGFEIAIIVQAPAEDRILQSVDGAFKKYMELEANSAPSKLLVPARAGAKK